MIKVLVLHDKDIATGEYKKKLIEKYAFLGQFDMYSLHIHKIRPNPTKAFMKRQFDKVYIDVDNLTLEDKRLRYYLDNLNNKTKLTVSFKQDGKSKMLTYIPTKIKEKE